MLLGTDLLPLGAFSFRGLTALNSADERLVPLRPARSQQLPSSLTRHIRRQRWQRRIFEQITTRIVVRRGHYLRSFAHALMEHCSPELTETIVKPVITPHRDSDE